MRSFERFGHSAGGRRPLGLLLAFCLAASVATAAEIKRNESLTLAAAELVLLGIQNSVGQVVVIGEEREDIELELLYRVRSKKLDQAQLVLEGLKLGSRREGGRLLLSPEYLGKDLARFREGPLRQVKVRIDIQASVPRELSVEASITSGDLFVSGIAGGVRTTATSGEVHVEDLLGDFQANQTSGDLIIERVAGDLLVQTTSGDVKLEQAGGEARVHTLSGDLVMEGLASSLTVDCLDGDIWARSIAGAIEVTSASGDIYLETAPGSIRINSSSGLLELVDVGYPDQSLDLTSSSGSVEVRLRPDPALRLELSTSLGVIRCRLPLKVQDFSLHRLTGVVGAGGGLIRLVTATGDIRIGTMEESQ